MIRRASVRMRRGCQCNKRYFVVGINDGRQHQGFDEYIIQAPCAYYDGRKQIREIVDLINLGIKHRDSQ